jgi:hypothetical protein
MPDRLSMIMMANADTFGDYKAAGSSYPGSAFAIAVTEVTGRKLITPFTP